MDENIKNWIKYLQDNGYELEEEFQTEPLILNEWLPPYKNPSFLSYSDVVDVYPTKYNVKVFSKEQDSVLDDGKRYVITNIRGEMVHDSLDDLLYKNHETLKTISPKQLEIRTGKIKAGERTSKNLKQLGIEVNPIELCFSFKYSALVFLQELEHAKGFVESIRKSLYNEKYTKNIFSGVNTPFTKWYRSNRDLPFDYSNKMQEMVADTERKIITYIAKQEYEKGYENRDVIKYTNTELYYLRKKEEKIKHENRLEDAVIDNDITKETEQKVQNEKETTENKRYSFDKEIKGVLVNEIKNVENTIEEMSNTERAKNDVKLNHNEIR